MNLKREITAIDSFLVKLLAFLEKIVFSKKIKKSRLKFILSKGFNCEFTRLKNPDNAFAAVIKPVIWPEGNFIYTIIYRFSDLYSVEEVNFHTPQMPEITGLTLKGRFDVYFNLDVDSFLFVEI